MYWYRQVPEPCEHLRLVLTPPDAADLVVLLTLTDARKKPSSRVVLVAGQHAAITKDTTVFFETCELVPAEVVRGLWTAQEPRLRQLNIKHVERICGIVRDHVDVAHRIRMALGWVPPQTARPNRFPRKQPTSGGAAGEQRPPDQQPAASTSDGASGSPLAGATDAVVRLPPVAGSSGASGVPGEGA
jgi:hypothetical protein